jgi:mannose-6-phosphate isomerase-like protein (cupin superfamily)
VTDGPIFSLTEIPAHLGLGATVVAQTLFPGEGNWYESYGERNAADGAEGRLVIMHHFTESWDSWEVHPFGEELVVCLDGSLVLYQDTDGDVRSWAIGAGQAAVNPRGTWHTADVTSPARVLFITAGMGTENRPR